MNNAATEQVTAPDPPGGRAITADPLFLLAREHAAVLDTVRELDDSARSIRERGFSAAAFDSIAGAGLFLDGQLREHEALEERHLLPVIERTDPGQAKAFREEHRVMRNLFARLRSHVAEIEKGRLHASSVADLLGTTREIVALLRRHVIHEDDFLHPLLREKPRAETPRTSGGQARRSDGPQPTSSSSTETHHARPEARR